jgi:hypothetical protein
VSARDGALHARSARDLEGLDRRGFLRLIAVAAAAGALPLACSRAPLGVAAPPGLRFLSARAWAVLNAAAARITGPPGAALIAAGRVDPALHADAFLAGAPSLAAPLAQALLALEFAIWPLVGKLRPFTGLAPEAQDAVLSELAESRIETKRRIFMGVRSVALMGFYASPEARALVRYPMGAADPAATIADAMVPAADERAYHGASREEP